MCACVCMAGNKEIAGPGSTHCPGYAVKKQNKTKKKGCESLRETGCVQKFDFFCVNIIINYYYYCSSERGGGFSLIFLCSQVESAWKCFGSASAAVRRPARPGTNVRPEPKTQAQPSWCSPSGGTQLSCADSAILCSQSRSYFKKKKKKKKTEYFCYCLLHYNVMLSRRRQAEFISIWAGARWAGLSRLG